MFSLIIPIFSKNDKYDKFLSNLNLSKNINFELIIAIQDYSLESLKKIKNIEKILEFPNLKIIFSSRKKSFANTIIKAIKHSSKKYTVISTIDVLTSKTIQNIDENIDEETTVDLIEFVPEINGITNWKPKWRNNLRNNTVYEINKIKNIVAYTFPFLTNKIIKTSLLKKTISIPINLIESSCVFGVDFFYIILLNSKTYKRINIKIAPISLEFNTLPSISNSIKQWNLIEEYYVSQNLYLSEILYAKLYFFQIILLGIYSNKNFKNLFRNNKIAINKIQKYISLLKNDKFLNFDISNPYMFNKTNETKILSLNETGTKTLSLLEE
ncbi:MAG: hypothetical protein ACRCRZ_02405 [Metamycoplasmataceae bacterium]